MRLPDPSNCPSVLNLFTDICGIRIDFASLIFNYREIFKVMLVQFAIPIQCVSTNDVSTYLIEHTSILLHLLCVQVTISQIHAKVPAPFFAGCDPIRCAVMGRE